jgi:hypothetical protein
MSSSPSPSKLVVAKDQQAMQELKALVIWLRTFPSFESLQGDKHVDPAVLVGRPQVAW